jgi:8-oxo-dGTP pyrophosphatase MutT (NUDIX family)
MVPSEPTVVDAAAAVIRTDDGRYLMQLRNRDRDIWYPGHWGCFGGAVDQGEGPFEALRRELREELELEISSARVVSRLDFDFEPVGLGKAYRIYYLVTIAARELRRLVLHEGERMEALSFAQVASGIPVVPYDAFAIHLTHARSGVSQLYNPVPDKSRR